VDANDDGSIDGDELVNALSVAGAAKPQRRDAVQPTNRTPVFAVPAAEPARTAKQEASSPTSSASQPPPATSQPQAATPTQTLAAVSFRFTFVAIAVQQYTIAGQQAKPPQVSASA
jgi:hypothetical protein